MYTVDAALMTYGAGDGLIRRDRKLVGFRTAQEKGKGVSDGAGAESLRNSLGLGLKGCGFDRRWYFEDHDSK